MFTFFYAQDLKTGSKVIPDFVWHQIIQRCQTKSTCPGSVPFRNFFNKTITINIWYKVKTIIYLYSIINQIKKKTMFFPSTDDLKWTVRKEPVQTESGIIIPKHMAIIRDDNNIPLSIMADGYQPYQNHELIELLERVSNQTGLEIKKSGMFGDGQKVFIQLKSNDLRLGNDRVEGYLTGINSFDGSTSLAFGPSNITISCQNSFFAAFRELNTKVRHTKNMVIRIDDICRGLETVIHEEKKIFDSIVKLSETPFDKAIEEAVTKKLFNLKRDVDLNDSDSISSITKNKLSRFYVDLNGEIKDKGENLWGLFSGITKFTTHSLTKNDNTETKMFGVYGKREQSIFNELVELI